MAHDADANRTAKRWLWLLVLPWIAMVWVLISAVITAWVYFKTKNRSKTGGPQGDAR